MSEENQNEHLSSVKDYAIFMLDPQGYVTTWTPGMLEVKGYTAEEIIGKHFSVFYTQEDRDSGRPQQILDLAARTGPCEDEGWRVRADGSRFWAHVHSTPVRDNDGNLAGFTHITRDMTDRMQAEERTKTLNTTLATRVKVNARLYEEARAGRDHLQAWSEELERKVDERTREIARHSKELTTRVLQAQEEERRRISRELHDDTAQSLSTLLINLDLLQPFLPPDVPELRTGIERVRDLTERTLESVRALSHDLRPTILDDFGLPAALQWFADEFRHTYRIPVDLLIEGEFLHRLSPDVELALFRIAQEALTNTGKYAGASRTRLGLTLTAEAVQLVVEDDGIGFDRQLVSGPTLSGGLGLYGMQERADLLGATLALETAPGRGSTITVVVPLLPVTSRSEGPTTET